MLANPQGCPHFKIAPDRKRHLILASEQSAVLVATASRHNLSGLDVPWRSHDSVTKQCVPLVVSWPAVGAEAERTLRNFDIYDVLMNHLEFEACLI